MLVTAKRTAMRIHNINYHYNGHSLINSDYVVAVIYSVNPEHRILHVYPKGGDFNILLNNTFIETFFYD